MSDSHDKLPKLFWIQLALAAAIGVMYFTAPAKHGLEHEASKGAVEAVSTNLAPVGEVAMTNDASSNKTKARSGEEVYKASCQSCHAAGIANAPKPEDKAAWEPRMAQGLDGLMKSALKGKGAMPAKGGNPSISDEEIKAVVLYMTKKAGFDLSANSSTEAPTSMAKSSPEMKNDNDNSSTAAVTSPPEAPAPTTMAISTPSAPVAPVAPSAPKEVATATMVTADTSTTPTTTMEVTKNTVAAAVDIKQGEKVYRGACFACHDSGVAGSPKIGDKAAWTTRIAAGDAALNSSAIDGKGVMPPKGGNTSLSDDDVIAAVAYMVSKSQ